MQIESWCLQSASIFQLQEFIARRRLICIPSARCKYFSSDWNSFPKIDPWNSVLEATLSVDSSNSTREKNSTARHQQTLKMTISGMKIQLKLMRYPVYPGICIDISAAFSFGEQCKIITAKISLQRPFQFYFFLDTIFFHSFLCHDASKREKFNWIAKQFCCCSFKSRVILIVSLYVVIYLCGYRSVSIVHAICIWNTRMFCPFIRIPNGFFYFDFERIFLCFCENVFKISLLSIQIWWFLSLFLFPLVFHCCVFSY